MISGRIKIFSEILSLAKGGTTIVASSGNATSGRAIDYERDTIWQSSGSDDTTTETLTITFPASTTLDRIHCLGINWKEFTIQYDNGGWQDFANVISIDDDTPGAGISETNHARNAAYYEFDSVSTTKIRIQIVKTQTADEEKILALVAATAELGTLEGWPEIQPDMDFERAENAMVDGRVHTFEMFETFRCRLDFRTYPTRDPYDADVALMMQLARRLEPFTVWLCGGGVEGTHFHKAIPGFRLIDLAQVKIVNRIRASYVNNIYTGPTRFAVQLEEHL